MLDSCVQRIWATIQCPDDSQWQAEYAEVNSEACFFNIFISELNNDSSANSRKAFKGTKLGGVAGKIHDKVSILSDLKKQRNGSTETSWGSRMMESQNNVFLKGSSEIIQSRSPVQAESDSMISKSLPSPGWTVSAFRLIWKMFQFLTTKALWCTKFSQSMSFSYSAVQNQTQYSRCGITSA